MTGNSERDSKKIFKIRTTSPVQWAISSQASWKQDEGSTTNADSPNVKPRAMKRHECSAALFMRADDIVYSVMRITVVADKEP